MKIEYLYSAKYIPGVMLLIAIGDWPYSYYQLLRIVVFVSSLFLARYYIKKGTNITGWVFLATALLFNPLLPVYLAKSTWVILDLAASAFFIYSPVNK